jgi:hypothetical protein
MTRKLDMAPLNKGAQDFPKLQHTGKRKGLGHASAKDMRFDPKPAVKWNR